MADVQITVVDQNDVQLALAAPAEAQIVVASPTFQGAVVESIDDLSDVDTSSTAPASGQTLLWDSVSSTWKPGTVATAAQGALADTAIQPASSINALSDVDTATIAPSGGQALIWASGTSQWEPGTVVGSIASGVSGATSITNCIALSQAAYDAIVTPDSSTLYVIV